ncbi:hypothetical protein [Azospirillum sp. B506]|uniref:hypothetical protein n=1 Tax=Azospirillum sp. B506 TaxID=137721 RepID=UPI0018FF5DB3|nr:hypothetical protein [Azospirillum sp. B506]
MDDTTLEQIAELICGDNKDTHPVYRTGGELTKFFANAGMPNFRHDGSTRKWWVLSALKLCTRDELSQVICRLASPREYRGDPGLTRMAISELNRALALEDLEVGLNSTQPYIKEKKTEFRLEPEEPEPQAKPMPNFVALNLEPGLGELLAQRWQEAQLCIVKGAHLSAIVMMGGLLEGLLLGVCQRNPRVINQASNAPRDPSTGKVSTLLNGAFQR